jgi:hypothetical protein
MRFIEDDAMVKTRGAKKGDRGQGDKWGSRQQAAGTKSKEQYDN